MESFELGFLCLSAIIYNLQRLVAWFRTKDLGPNISHLNSGSITL